MATYNGSAYLDAQIESLQQQTLKDWLLLIRDDGSTDDTIDILGKHTEHDPRIQLLHDDQGNLGASACFGRLIEEAFARGANYVACCDQDDVWLPRKLEDAVEAMRTLERSQGTHTPLLVHSDLEVVDEQLQTLSDSFMDFENIPRPDNPPLKVLLVQNHVVGCTALFNRALLEIALPIPADVRMHDWWLALCARCFGKLGYMPDAPIRYRQHTANTLGAAGFNHIYRIFRRSWWRRLGKRPKLHRALISQARELTRLAATHAIPDSESAHQLQRYWQCATRELGLLRVACAARAGIRGQNFVTTTLFYFLLLVSRWGATKK